ncbi:hypothetical protein EG832_20805 [bacterium]|nr:hypothetical protein [bacterium]
MFRYLRREDIQTLIQRLPEGSFQQLESSRAVMERMFQKVIGRNEDCDLDVAFNWIQLLNLTVENQDMLAAVAFEKTFDGLLKVLLNEIFNEKEA